jgi:hypothetical protein
VILEGCGLHRTYEPLVGGWVLGAPVGGRTVTLAGWGAEIGVKVGFLPPI